MRTLNVFVCLALATAMLGQAPNASQQRQGAAQTPPQPTCPCEKPAQKPPVRPRRTVAQRVTPAPVNPAPPPTASVAPAQPAGFTSEQLNQIKGLMEAMKPNITVQPAPAPNVTIQNPAPQQAAAVTLPPIDFSPVTQKLDEQIRIGNRTNTLLEKEIGIEQSTRNWTRVGAVAGAVTAISTTVTAVEVHHENGKLNVLNNQLGGISNQLSVLPKGMDGIATAIANQKPPEITITNTANGGTGGAGGAGGTATNTNNNTANGGTGGAGGNVTGSGNSTNTNNTTANGGNVTGSGNSTNTNTNSNSNSNSNSQSQNQNQTQSQSQSQ